MVDWKIRRAGWSAFWMREINDAGMMATGEHKGILRPMDCQTNDDALEFLRLGMATIAEREIDNGVRLQMDTFCCWCLKLEVRG